jgi:hypothetical protein
LEEQLERYLETPAQPQALAAQKPLAKQPLFIITLSLAIISIAAIGILYQGNTEMKKLHNDQQLIIEGQTAKIDTLTKNIDSYKGDSAKITELDSRATAMASALLLSAIQHQIEGGIVTDDFAVEKVHFKLIGDDALAVIIDVINQPQMAAFYKGMGGFDLTDRELRAKSTAIIDAVKDRYSSSVPDNMPKWDDANVSLTIKNYAIGDSTSGKFMLVGEK